MPIIRVVMPNGTTRAFREGTPKNLIDAAKRDMIGSMRETPADYETYRRKRRILVTQDTDGEYDDEPWNTGISEAPIPRPASTYVDDASGDEPWNADSQQPVTPPAVQRAVPPLTAEQLGQILPGAKPAAIANYLDGLNTAMAGMTRNQQAAFLGQVSVENPKLHSDEDLTYSEAGARANFRNVKNDPNLPSYLHDPQALANHAYNGVNGNMSGPNSTDGYDYRGRGLLQITGRDGYRSVGLEDSPEALSTPDVSSQASVDFWNSRGLNDASANVLDRAGFDKITHAISGNAMKFSDQRWQGYQRALKVFGVPPQ